MYLETVTRESSLRFSEPSMMEYFGGMPEFSVRGIRNLEHQHFRMIQAVVWHAESDSELLLVNRLTEGEPEDHDVLAIFQRDHAGPLSELANEHLSGDREHFADEFKALYPRDGDTPLEVTYTRIAAEEFHGIKETDGDGPFLSQALYETGDDDNFPLALVEWEKDWLTAWFGMELRRDHVAFL